MDVALAAITPQNAPTPRLWPTLTVDNDLVAKNLKVISRASFRRSSNT
jgi:hypothetical protein